MEFLAVDLGTSFIKTAIVDVADLRIREVRRCASPPNIGGGPADTVEINPSDVLSVVRKLVDDLLALSGDCLGILMCGQMGGLILLDQFHTPVSAYMSWQDRRACRIRSGQTSYFQYLQELVADQTHSVLGNELRPGLSPSLLSYIFQTQPQRLSDSTIPVTLPDYIAAALCGKRPVTEVTNAPGVVSIVDRKLATDVLQQAGVPPLDWPLLVNFQHRVGEYKSGTQTVPVYAATGDHQCSLVGTLLRRGELSINIATGSQISLLTTENHCKEFQLRPFFDGQWLKTITNIPAGRALTTILKLLVEVSGKEPGQREWDYFFRAADETVDSDVAVNLGLFPGAIPGPGLLGNLSESNLTVGHIARAALQQMATQYEQLSVQLDRNRKWDRIALSGGLARKSALLRQLVCNALSTESRMAPTDDDALFGLLVLGRVVAGLEPDVMSAIASVARQLKI